MKRNGQVLLTKDDLALWASFDGPQWAPFKAAWLNRGFDRPPSPKQREVLWEIVDARPKDVARWVREAKWSDDGNASWQVVAHVIHRWSIIERATLANDERLAAEQRRRAILAQSDTEAPEVLGAIFARMAGR